MAYLRGKLLEKRRNFLERLTAELRATAETSAQLSSDTADMAFSNASQDTSWCIGTIESATLTQIDRALRRMEDGTYGVCEECGKRIPALRLKALPFASLCVRCKREEERLERAEEEQSERPYDRGEPFDEDFNSGDPKNALATVRGKWMM